MQEFKQCNQQEVHQYIKTILNPFLQPMVYHLVLKRFDNPVTAAIQWLSKYSKNNLLKVCRAQSQQLSELDDQNKEQVKQLEQKIKKNRINRNHFKNRSSFSEQSFGMFNHPKSIVKQDTIQISEDQMKLIKPLLSNSILFETLDYKDEQIIFQSIKIKKAQEFEIIIKQGQEGNLLYIVQSGQYDCYKLINEENILVKTYYPGQTFGDLALMYNSPRSATIVTKKPGKLLTLDRSTFSRILKVAAMRKQSTILNTIKSLKFSTMVPQDQIHQLVHIFKEEKFIEGEYILRKGQISNKLYVVLEGTIAEESKESNQKFNQLNGEGTLFNENGFWNNGCVDVNIKAVTLTKVGVLSCTQFKRVFGSIWDQLRIKK